MEQVIEKYRMFDEELCGTAAGNPYEDITLDAEFSSGQQRCLVHGFYKGNGRYGIRFMPRAEGIWRWTVRSNDARLDGASGAFRCVAASAGNHGPVRLAKEVYPLTDQPYGDALPFRFCYEDGTPYAPFGTTCYAWIHQKPDVQAQTLRTLAQAPFNKLRMCVFPKFYTYNTTDPDCYPFEGNAEEGFDFTRFNEAFFSHLEDCIARLDALGIEADIILLHPYDRWGFAKMSKAQDAFYLSYLTRRLSAFKNVWWSLANEYDLMPWKRLDDWEAYARIIMENDPCGHLRSIHNCLRFYNYHRSWITHLSIQRVDVYKTAEIISDLKQEYQKPVIMDEAGYEGNINLGWGSLTGEELTRRFWEGCLRDGYLSHGETFVDRGPAIWWSHGGTLSGDSVSRIRFLRDILADAPRDCVQLPLTEENHEANWDAVCFQDEGYRLYYYGFFRMAYRMIPLPEDERWSIEIIDTWNMKVTKLPGSYHGEVRVELPGRQYMALRLRRLPD